MFLALLVIVAVAFLVAATGLRRFFGPAAAAGHDNGA